MKCRTLEEIADRTLKRVKAAAFFMKMINADCERIAVENPVGVMNTVYRKPDQIIEPYYFAESEKDTENYVTKRTCLWLKGLPVLERTTYLDRPKPFGSYIASNGKKKNICWEMKVSTDRQRNRSKTFPGIAKAMAEQWG